MPNPDQTCPSRSCALSLRFSCAPTSSLKDWSGGFGVGSGTLQLDEFANEAAFQVGEGRTARLFLFA